MVLQRQRVQPALKSHTPNKAGRQKRGRMTFASDSDMKCISVNSLFFTVKPWQRLFFQDNPKYLNTLFGKYYIVCELKHYISKFKK